MDTPKAGEDRYIYYKDNIHPHIIELEKERFQIAKKLYLLLIPLSIVSIAGGFLVYKAWEIHGLKFYSLIAILVIIVIYKLFTDDFIKKFKNRVIQKIISFVHESFQYRPEMYIDVSEFNESKIFYLKSNNFYGDDFVWGKVDKTEIKFSEVHARKGHGRYQTCIFDGLFFRADFNKDFNGTTIVLPDSDERLFGHLGTVFQSLRKDRGELVYLEDLEFESYFKVYGTDQIESRYILSLSLMRRLVEFRQKMGRNIYLSFNQSSLFIAIPSTIAFFEPRIFSTLLSYDDIMQYFADAQLAVDIVNDLNLNLRIWSKE